MGVKLLIRTQPPKGVTGPAHYDLLKRLVDELCASQLSGRSEAWSVTCQLMKQGNVLAGVAAGGPGPGPGGSGGLLRDTWAVTFREAPDLTYLLLRPDAKVLECEGAVLRLLEKKLEYSRQMAVRIEGHTYSKGDFLIRLCTATQAIHSTQSLLGHCLEVEYLPVSCIPSAEGPVAEFVDLVRQHLALMLPPGAGGEGGAAGRADGRGGGASALQLELVKPAYDKYGLSSMSYGRAHAAVAYSDLAVAMLSSSAAAASAQQQQQQQAPK